MITNIIRWFYHIFDRFILKKIVNVFYSKGTEDLDSLYVLRLAFIQKIIGINRSIPWPVHFTSMVLSWENIKMGRGTVPGLALSSYIQAINGIIFGNNVLIAPRVTIASANHDYDDYDKHVKTNPIKIGNDVWIGANVIILPGVQIGNNVIIGAGSMVSEDIPNNCIVAGNPCRIIRDKPAYKGRRYV